MSTPNPATSQFIPVAFESAAPLTVDELLYLENNFVLYPNAQGNVNFPVAPTAPTLADGTNTTQVATTGFVQNAITAFLSTVNTWLGLQTFNQGMTSDSINPILSNGTLTIGNAAVNTNVEIASSIGRSSVLHLGDGNNSTGAINIGNGASSSNNVNILNGTGSTGTINLGTSTTPISLGAPITPAYLYPIATGKIGEIINYTGSTAAITFTADVPLQVMSLTGFAPGTWIMTASVTRANTPANVYLTIALSTTTADVTSSNAFGIEYASGSASGFGITTSLSCIIQSTNVTTVYYVNAQTGTGGGTQVTPAGWRAIRIA